MISNIILILIFIIVLIYYFDIKFIDSAKFYPISTQVYSKKNNIVNNYYKVPLVI